MASLSPQIDSHREQAEIYNGEALCKQKARELFDKFRLPKGLLPMNDLDEMGFNSITGFLWLKQQNKSEFKFKSVGKTVAYETEVTAFVEDRRMRRLTGIKTKDIMIWIPISDISINDNDPTNITFSSSSCVSKTFPVEAFEDEDQSN